MSFTKLVCAHLVGWCIVQPLYNRLVRYVRNREMENPSKEMRFYWRQQADEIVDVMEERGHLDIYRCRHGDPDE
jgi:hypothetical protein